MSDKTTQQKFLEAIKEDGSIKTALTESGATREMLVSWCGDEQFWGKALRARAIGQGNFSDLVESILIEKVKAGDLSAAKYCITSRDWQSELPRPKTKPETLDINKQLNEMLGIK